MDNLSNDPYLHFNTDTLNTVRKLYDLDRPGRMEETILLLEEWIKKQNHFTLKEFDRNYLERVIIDKKGSVERAKLQIDKICTFRTTMPKYFIDFNIEEDFKCIIGLFWVFPLPKMTKTHDRVILYKLKHSELDPQKFVVCIRYFMIMAEYLKMKDYFRSIVLIIDYGNTNLIERLAKINLSDLRDFLTIAIEGYGARVSQIHLISESTILDFVFSVAKQLLNPKLLSRLKVHRNIETVKEYIDSSILPVDLGGSEKSLDALRSAWYEVINDKKHVEYAKKMFKARTDESRRSVNLHSSDYMGMPGSFRNLKFD